MNIATTIKQLRVRDGLTQERFADALGVSVQTVSRWENAANAPDISLLPAIARIFDVTTDYLLGVEGERKPTKLLKTVETFEFSDRAEADAMIARFKAGKFPIYVAHRVLRDGAPCVVEVEKRFDIGLEEMKFHL